MLAATCRSVRRALPPLALVLLGAAFTPGALRAQTRTFTACTPDALAVCAELRLTSAPTLFEIGVRTLGASGSAGLPVSLYNLVFGTGSPEAATPGFGAPLPVASGGAVVSDASPWDVFDSGDVIFLSALTNRGVGGCVIGADVDGFGQAARTCGAGQFISFSFVPTSVFNPSLFTLLNFEAVALMDPSQGASCGSPDLACVITEGATPPSTLVPEPLTLTMLGAGLAVLGVGSAVRRRRACT